MDTALTIIFLTIFGATAIITLGSLPGWIPIPENYRNKLFYALLLEVVVCTILLFRTNVLKEKPQSLVATDWVALKSNGQILDTIKGTNISLFSEQARKFATYDLSKEKNPDDTDRNDYVIKNKNAVYIGKLSIASLNTLNFFDVINVDENKFEQVKFTKQDGKWSSPKTSLGLTISVNDTKYCIADTAQQYYNECDNDFNKFARKLHSFKGGGETYYFVHISEANLMNPDKTFVTFSVIKIKPRLGEK